MRANAVVLLWYGEGVGVSRPQAVLGIVCQKKAENVRPLVELSC